MIWKGWKELFRSVLLPRRKPKPGQTGYKFWQLIEKIERIIITKDLRDRQALIGDAESYAKKNFPGLYTELFFKSAMRLYSDQEDREANRIVVDELNRYLLIYDDFGSGSRLGNEWYCEKCEMWTLPKEKCNWCLSKKN